jgi:hypothetical protein
MAHSPSRRRTCAALSLAPLAVLSGCATPPPLARVPRGAAVQLVFAGSADSGPLKVENLDLRRDAQTGAGGGALVGALSGFSCGFFAIVCVPFGALFGGLVGAGGGAVVGLGGELTAAEIAPLQERLQRARQSHDLLAGLRQTFTRRMAEAWTVTDEQPAYVMTLHLRHMQLTSDRQRQIGMVVQVRASLRRADPAATEALADREYRHATEPAALATWLDEGSDFPGAVFSRCSQQLSAQIAADFAPG